ncbi:DUF4388 domain-containing protein [Flexistipes sp.]|uniref:DUF4388 domain-containing protein n=1 Tax=Flexistipes sp. TaxID=3088135 RepID=UPI002E1EE8AA|nr:DUF4388 domain-containing protein [Flexistipes sp.]
MALKGSIKEFSLVDILQLLSQTSKSGILHITNESQHIKVFIKDGMLVEVKSDSDDFMIKIGNYLTSREFITKERLNELLGKQKKLPVRFGKLLVNEGILSNDELKNILTEITKENFAKVLSIDSGQYNFEQTIVEYNEDERELLDINNILLDVLKDIDELNVYKKKISSFLVKYYKTDTNKKIVVDNNISDEEPVIIVDKTIKLNNDSYLVYNKINGSNSVADIIEQTILPEHFVLKVIYFLIKEKQIAPAQAEKLRTPLLSLKTIQITGLGLLFIAILTVLTMNISTLFSTKLFTFPTEEQRIPEKIYYEQLKEVNSLTYINGETSIDQMNLNHKNYMRYFTIE